MIDKEEIIQKSGEFEIHSSNVQRDYVFGWILAGIYTISNLKDYLILKGGNCLRKAYFESTRYSNDLDFSIQTDLSEDFLRTELNKVCDFAQEASGVIFEKERNRVERKKGVDLSKKAYEARLYFKDFYGNESKIIISIRLDIRQHEKIYLPVQSRFIIHPYSDYRECKVEIRCLKLEEVLASKLKCLLQRRHPGDLYDYVFSIIFETGIELSRAEIVKTLLKMTIFERSPGILRGLFVDLPFQIFKHLWRKYLLCPKHRLIDFDMAVERFKTHVIELFGNLPIGRGHNVFFPAALRNTILEAGSHMTLLEVVYDGIRRIVEPYSLVYKTPRNGIGKEYFYVYDRTGGRTSGPGIKCLLHTKIQDLKLTEEKFEPRYQVELSKAGELPEKSYFGKPFSERISTSRKSTLSRKSTSRLNRLTFLSTAGPIYVYKCPICQKTFRRKTLNSRLNKHKDKYKNQCFGKVGTFIRKSY